MASGHVNRIKRPNTWLHRPMLQNVKKALANSEPSTHGGKADLRPNLHVAEGSTSEIGLFLNWDLVDPPPDGMFPATLKEGTMAEAKLAPNLPEWMVAHANRYLASGGTDGHMYKVTVPGQGEITAPALLLTTTGRKSGVKFIFPLFYGTEGGSYFVIATKGGAPQHPGWYRNILVNPDVEVQVGTKKMNARARTTAGEERLRLWKQAIEFWPPYADYQLKTEREIPVVVLDPVH